MTVTSAIIPASGLGKRLGSGSDKVFVNISGLPIIVRTLRVFQECANIDEIIIVVRSEQISPTEEIIRAHGITKAVRVVSGGDTRQDSVRNGLAHVSPQCDIVAIHDGARPFVTPEIISSSIKAAIENRAAIVAVPVIDTIKSSSDGKFIDSTLERSCLYAVQTPQTFEINTIRDAFERAYADSFLGTDDASLVERLGIPVRIVEGSYENIKITTPNDLSAAEGIVCRREGKQMRGMEFRTGHGYDIHRFAPGRKLFLGGVEFTGCDGLLGHSDADVLLHAVADSLLGAVGAGDIGVHFPDTDPAYKGADSLNLLSRVSEVVTAAGWRTANVDVTLIAERPKVSKHTGAMRVNIATALGITPEQVNIKATTAEGLGAIGEGLGIECHAVALLYPL
ncbi:MAG: 2-C-methyl-D-erythritol 4-phosphate cytidylyltransferase [Armatimonadota bacterium]